MPADPRQWIAHPQLHNTDTLTHGGGCNNGMITEIVGICSVLMRVVMVLRGLRTCTTSSAIVIPIAFVIF